MTGKLCELGRLNAAQMVDLSSARFRRGLTLNRVGSRYPRGSDIHPRAAHASGNLLRAGAPGLQYNAPEGSSCLSHKEAKRPGLTLAEV